MELAARLVERFGLVFCDVVPSDPASDSAVLGIAESAAGFLDQKLAAKPPIIVAIGTGRMMRAAVEPMPRMICRQHKLVSLVGHISMQGRRASSTCLPASPTQPGAALSDAAAGDRALA